MSKLRETFKRARGGAVVVTARQSWDAHDSGLPHTAIRAVGLLLFILFQFFAVFVVLRTLFTGWWGERSHSGTIFLGKSPLSINSDVVGKEGPSRFRHAAATTNSSRRGDALSTTPTVSGLENTNTNEPPNEPPLRILYIVTTLAEYNTGGRGTKHGQDRLRDILLPILKDGVTSMVSPPYNYKVDVYLILGYHLQPERKELILTFLPEGVGLQIWDDASPYTLDRKRDGGSKIWENTRSLARQHRFVIRDKLDHYDFFAAFEDDMRITGEHVHHYITMSKELDRRLTEKNEKKTLGKFRKDEQKNDIDAAIVPEHEDPAKTTFHGPMTQLQMSRLIPGFVRVEVLLDEKKHGAQTRLDPIPMDWNFAVVKEDASGDVVYKERHVDPRPCCHVPNIEPGGNLPPKPTFDKIVLWETGIKGLSVRQLPGSSSMMDWVALLSGPGKRLAPEEYVGGYWSGRDGAFGDERKPSGATPTYLAQQAGWMATREQLIRFHTEKCMDGFLPPYDQPWFKEDGNFMNNVEFWSGGFQLFTGVKGGCNMQRVISLDPDHFSKHLIYHTVNNKQRTLPRERFVKADNLFGQLNTVMKAAMKAKEAETGLGVSS